MVAKPRKNSQQEMDRTIDAGIAWLDAVQNEDGSWAGMLESNSCMEAEWIMAFHVLGVDFAGSEKLVGGILSRQREDGAWETYYDATSGDINTTVEAYVALRVAGLSPERREMRAAREWILGHGGLSSTRVFTRYWLALLGEWPWEKTPNLPPEMIRLPTWVPFNIYHFASWARATLLPLAVLSAKQFTRPLPEERRPGELFPGGREHFDYSLQRRDGFFSRASVFRGIDRVLHFLQRHRVTPGRESAIARCLEWIVRHQEADGAWGGIQPPWIYSLLALRACGYASDHPVLEKGISTLHGHWSYERDGKLFIQACDSVVWDTMLALLAKQACDRNPDNDEGVAAAADWLLNRECRYHGDWSVLTPHEEPGGWAFERANRHYPDMDDTAVAVLALAGMRGSTFACRIAGPVQRAIDWVLAMQSDNGGWGAFDRNNHNKLITRIPFCDFGEALDPPSADVTAHVVEGLAAAGVDSRHPALMKALDYLWREQESAGCWFGRWGVNYIYGTAAVLPAMSAMGEDMSQRRIRRAVAWLVEKQNDDGGWGETCASYMDLALAGTGTSTASQTAWGLIALLAVGSDECRDPVLRGVAYLQRNQRDGTWQEDQYTGCGFPGYGIGARLDDPDRDWSRRLMQGPELARAFMINYNLYRHYFPLIALGRARRWLAGEAANTVF